MSNRINGPPIASYYTHQPVGATARRVTTQRSTLNNETNHGTNNSSK